MSNGNILKKKLLVGLVFFIIPSLIYSQKIKVEITANNKKGAVYSTSLLGSLPFNDKVDLDRISQIKVVTEDGELQILSKTELKDGSQINIQNQNQIAQDLQNIYFEGLSSQIIMMTMISINGNGVQTGYDEKEFNRVCEQLLNANSVTVKSKEDADFILSGKYLGEKPMYKQSSMTLKDYASFTIIKWELRSKISGKVLFEKEIEGGFYTGKIRLGNAVKAGEEKNYASRKSVESSLKTLLQSEDFVAALKNSDPEKNLIPSDLLTLKPNYSDISSIDDCIKATVSIKTASGFGSGFIIDNSGYILTNQHVIGSQKSVVVVLSAGFSVTGEVVRQSEEIDVALIKIPLEDLKPIKLSQTGDNLVGDDVIAIGTPAQLKLNQTVTKGIISGNREESGIRLIQTDVSINSGNSGGPLINSKNEVIGIITSKLVGIGTEGIGFAIPIRDALSALNITIAKVD